MKTFRKMPVVIIAALLLGGPPCLAIPIGIEGVSYSLEEDQSYFRFVLTGQEVKTNANTPNAINLGHYWPFSFNLILHDSGGNAGATDFVNFNGNVHHAVAPHGENASGGVTFSFMLAGGLNSIGFNGLYAANENQIPDSHGVHLDFYRGVGTANITDDLDEIVNWTLILSGGHLPQQRVSDEGTTITLLAVAIAGFVTMGKFRSIRTHRLL